MTTFVEIKHKNGAVGTVPARAVKHWEGRGYTVVDPEGVEAAIAEDAQYDPSEYGAQEVHDHLAALDTVTPEGQAEYDRIVAAEKSGKNRTTAIPTS